MGIPDNRPFGLFGLWQQPGNFYRSRVSHDQWGTPTGPSVNLPYGAGSNVLESQRGGKTSNRRRPLSGTTSLWIPPSSYDRSIVSCVHIQTGIYQNFGIRGFPQHVYTYGTANPLLLKQVRAAVPGYWAVGGNQTSVEDTNMTARTITECLLNLKDQKVNLGENLATLKQTTDLFAKHGSTLFKSFRAAKSGNWKRAFAELGLKPSGRPVGLGLSQRYLEYVYGVKPLVQDIHGLYELMNEQLKPALLVYARRTLRDSKSYTQSGFNSTFNLDWNIEGVAKKKYKTALVGRVSSSVARDVARAGLSNPASLAWDLMPWSFVIDWSTPIGSVLSALDATQGLDFVGGYTSRIVEGTEVFTAPSGRGGYVLVDKTSPYKFASFRFSNVRFAYQTWPAPQFYAKSPLSTSHVVTALALFRQLF